MSNAIQKVGPWGPALASMGGMSGRFQRAVERAVKIETTVLRDQIRKGIRDQAPGGVPFKPLKDTTLAVRFFRRKRSTKALIVDADLLRSVNVKFSGRGVGIHATVGVHKEARGRSGKDMVNIAAVHEFGTKPFAVPLTPKAIRFIMAAFRAAGLPPKSGGSGGRRVAIIQIPARPYLRPTFDKWRKGIQERFARWVSFSMRLYGPALRG